MVREDGGSGPLRPRADGSPLPVLDPRYWAVPEEPVDPAPLEPGLELVVPLDPIEPVLLPVLLPVLELLSLLEPVVGFLVVEPVVPVALEPVSLEPVVVEPALPEFIEPLLSFEVSLSDFIEPLLSLEVSLPDFMDPLEPIEPEWCDFIELLPIEPVPELMPVLLDLLFRAWCFFIFFLVVVVVLLDVSLDGFEAVSLLLVELSLPAPVPMDELPVLSPALTPNAAAASPATSRYLSFLCIPFPSFGRAPPLHATAARPGRPRAAQAPGFRGGP